MFSEMLLSSGRKDEQLSGTEKILKDFLLWEKKPKPRMNKDDLNPVKYTLCGLKFTK